MLPVYTVRNMTETPASYRAPVRIEPGDLDAADVRALLGEHLADMYATSPPESVHALSDEGLREPAVTFFTARDDDGVLLGCGALKQLDDGAAELKTMRTVTAARGRGVGSAMLTHLLGVARARECTAVYLETGSMEYFAAARRLYARHGFVETGPFADYAPDPLSTFMVLRLIP
ncbi:GNAT family N-acetyltransferase [Georgenia phoenicis]|uniref:GNAT family N-acetyltransferase n=1 Tax=unclassified Georgenia TaxID=2626815 RepID=UPI0039AFEE8E